MPLIDLSDVKCYFEQTGSAGGDPLLLIPGLGRTCRIWDGVCEPLSEHFSLIMPDNRGMGRSIPKRNPRNLRDLAVDLVELMDALQIERAHVMGISLGGMIGQWLAVDHPGRVEKLVLVSTAHHFGPYLREVAKLLGHALRYFSHESFERTVEVLGSSPRFIDSHPDWIAERIACQRQTKPSRGAVARQLICLAHSDVCRDEYRIHSPTLVIAGEHDALIPSCYGRQIADDIPDSRFLLVPECGHNPFIECPDFMVSHIVEFLSGGNRPHDRRQQQPELAGAGPRHHQPLRQQQWRPS